MTSPAETHGYSTADFIDDVKAMLDALGPTAAALEQAGRLMRHLTGRDDLHPAVAHAGLADGHQSVVLHEEPDASLTLVLAKIPAAENPVVHGHGMWGVVCGYQGAALQVKYERRDDGARVGYAELAEAGRKRLERGDAAWWLDPPHDVHSLEARDGGTAWVLVLHGGMPGDHLVFDPDQVQVSVRPGKPACAFSHEPSQHS